MTADLRKSLDLAVQTQKMLRLGLQIVTKRLEHEPSLEDSLVVYLAEWCNTTIRQLKEVDAIIELIVEQLRIFGDDGLEKEFSITFEGGA